MKKCKMGWCRIIFACVFLSAIAACSADKDSYKARYETVNSNTEELRIAVAWPLDPDFRGTKTTMLKGVKLAVEEINSAGGLKDGRRIVVEEFDDRRDINEGARKAEEIAADKSLFAVIGHLDSYISVPTSTTYEVSGLIVLNPGSTDARLTQNGYKHIFRLVPKNIEQGHALARYLKKEKQIERVLLYYIQNDYGHALGSAFAAEARASNIEIVDKRGYYKTSREHRKVMKNWCHFYEVDAIVLAGSMPEGLDIIRSIREAGITKPIYAGGGLDSIGLIKDVAKDHTVDRFDTCATDKTDGTDDTSVYVISFFPLGYTIKNGSQNRLDDMDDSNIVSFYEAYKSEYDEYPVEAAAALGYDAVKLLAKALNETESLDRTEVSDAIRQFKNYSGASGVYNFDDSGDAQQKLMVINRIEPEKLDDSGSLIESEKFVFESRIQ